MIFITKNTSLLFFVQEASVSFYLILCSLSQESGIFPFFMSSFSSLVFLCFGTFTNVASTIVPSLRVIFFFLIWFRNKLKSLFSTLCFIKVSLKFHSVFLSGILFDIPRKFLKDSLRIFEISFLHRLNYIVFVR